MSEAAASMRQVDPRYELDQNQLDAIAQFEADYNAIDHFLQQEVGIERYVPFMRLVTEYARKHSCWRDAEVLRMAASVRNAIVHGRTERYGYPAVPSAALAVAVRACRDRLLNPARVIPAFERTVEVVSVNDPLAKVLTVVAQRDYSQFPVYDGERFCGLLTENGITRWLANHMMRTIYQVDLERIDVGRVLQNEEHLQNYAFLCPSARVDEVRERFASEALLEAVLITPNGEVSEKLSGIATRWDMLQLV